MLRVMATTACFPGVPYVEAARRLAAGLVQAPWGKLGVEEIQVCPQHPGLLDQATLDAMRAILPKTQMRLHATVRVQRERFIGDDAWLSPTSLPYYQRLADLSQQIEAPAYVFHAGPRRSGSLERIVEQAQALTKLFGCPVGVEGQYPTRDSGSQDRWLLSTWEEYAALLGLEVHYAIDLSHLNILYVRTGVQHHELVRALLMHRRCLEVHVSDNNGAEDLHRPMRAEKVWWQPLLEQVAEACPELPIFSEAASSP